MQHRIFKPFFTVIVFLALTGSAKAQAGLCPPNLDFESGDFSNWICRAGSVAVDGGTGLNTIIWNSVGPPVFDRHTMISLAGAGDDIYGNFPRVCPNGSGFSVKLGNETASLSGGIGREASGISYTFTIPPTATTYSIFFYYAVVLENPTHPSEQQPRFRASIKDLSTGTNFPCVSFDFIAGVGSGGFLPSPRNPSVLYKDWTPITLDLSGLAGRTIEIEFIATECTQQGHFAYAYVDVNTSCNSPIQGATICQGDNAITLTAPFGYQSYQWFADASYTTTLSTTQIVTLDPAPAVGSVLPVIVDPYPGFGCRDTLFATINVAPKPVSVAGVDANTCKFGSVQIGGPDNPIHSYEWSPASQVSNPFVSNPFAAILPSAPTVFTVKTTDILTGCFSYDDVLVSNTVVDTAIRLAGTASFCDYGPLLATLSVNNISSPIQWYDNTTLIAGATGPTYQPSVSGSYWASVTQGVCTDTTARINVTVNPLPVALFSPVNDSLCVDGGSIVFSNLSTVPDGSPMTHNWKFSDGTTIQTKDATKVFPGPGDYTIELVSTTTVGCKDSVSTSIYVLPNAIPDFSWDPVCIDRPVQFKNLSNEAGSASVNYSWDFNNDGPGSVAKDPPPVIFATAGSVDVTLELTSLGCETVPQSVTKTIQVNTAAPGATYRTVTVPEGSSAYLHARPGIGETYLWQPQQQLSSYHTQYTEFFATGNDVRYLIDITNKYTCITTDTVLMQILKKPGFYLPTAFTPNGDGLNDLLQPYLVGMKGLKSFTVFNRWGNQVFRSVTYGEGWNGKFRGQDQTPGVYVWILEFYNGNNKLVTEKGTVTIVR
ncbi:MAG TPA: PKD domain-containing protein [Chitinophagaceae bacterium]|jgi:gliding motility-associated-like protein|nr:PKD domain-containing protein [Chitinophagaceae bacterium]